jgi:hypothetical protein
MHDVACEPKPCSVTTMIATEVEIRQRYEQAGQGHVFDHIAELAAEQKVSFLQQLDDIKVEQLTNIFEAAKNETLSTSSKISPFTGAVGKSTDEVLTANFRKSGMEAIRSRKVAAVVCIFQNWFVSDRVYLHSSLQVSFFV